MALFPETTSALSELAANAQYGYGDHTEQVIRTGVAGLPLGDTQFDPTRHQLSDVNHLAPLSAATGDMYVREVLPRRPISVNVVLDVRTGREHPVITNQKQRAQQMIAHGLVEALPGITDHAATYVLSDGTTRNQIDFDGENVPVHDDEDAGRKVEDIALSGLTFVVSDFKQLRLQRIDGQMIAIKANHPLERSIPRNIGFVSLGGAVELDTHDRRQLERVNTALWHRHLDIIDDIKKTGAKAVSVKAEPKSEHGFYVQHTDHRIAAVVHEMNQ